MNAKKKIEAKWSISLGIAMLMGFVNMTVLYGMEPEIVQQSHLVVQVYFVPQDQDKIMNGLSWLLDNAKQQVLVAMYWITDQSLIEKLIAAKKRGVDVQIIMDESIADCFDLNSIINQFLQNDIVPIIHPSKNIEGGGKMHNKFVVVDNAMVFTGSANFTKTALNPSANSFNFETVVVIDSADIAKQFVDNFDFIKKEIVNFYVEMIVLTDFNQLPEWIRYLLPIMYKNQPLMQQFVQEIIVNHNLGEQKIINNFFGIQPKPATEQQLNALNKKGFSKEALSDLSHPEAVYLLRNNIRPDLQGGLAIERQPKQETSDLTGKSLKQEKFLGTRTSKKWESVTENQKNFLIRNGFTDMDIEGLSKQEASKIISDIKEEFGITQWKEPATEAQLRLLSKLGVPDEEMFNVSKQEASVWISQLKEEQATGQYSW